MAVIATDITNRRFPVTVIFARESNICCSLVDGLLAVKTIIVSEFQNTRHYCFVMLFFIYFKYIGAIHLLWHVSGHVHLIYY